MSDAVFTDGFYLWRSGGPLLRIASLLLRLPTRAILFMRERQLFLEFDNALPLSLGLLQQRREFEAVSLRHREKDSGDANGK